MFSAQELEWVKALIETMREKGFNYYVAQTVTSNNNDIDVMVYFSKQPIIGNSLYNFTVNGGVVYSLDSSGYYSNDTNESRTKVLPFSGNLVVARTEFVYTNAEYIGSTLQPDIRQCGGVINETGQAVFHLVTLCFLVAVVLRFFGSR